MKFTLHKNRVKLHNIAFIHYITTQFEEYLKSHIILLGYIIIAHA